MATKDVSEKLEKIASQEAMLREERKRLESELAAEKVGREYDGPIYDTVEEMIAAGIVTAEELEAGRATTEERVAAIIEGATAGAIGDGQ